MDRSLRLAGWGNLLLYGALALAPLVGAAWLRPEALVPLVPAALVCAVAAAAGWALLRGQAWARPALWGVSIAGLLLVPVGTALGIYTLWVLHRSWVPGTRAAPYHAAGLAGPVLLFVLPYLHTMVYFASAAEREESVARHRHDAYAFVETFLEDQRHLSGLGVFEPTARERDAGPFLNARVPRLGEPPAEEVEHFPIARLPHEARLQLRGDPPPDYAAVNLTQVGLDFRWMTALLAYDHWQWEAPDRPVPERLTQFTDYPMPDFMELRAWARLRLESALDEPEPILTLGEVRHLAGLVYSTHTLVGALVAVEMLDDERRVVEAWRAANPKAELRWTSLTEDDVARARRAIWGFRGYVHLHTDPELMQLVLADPAIQLGRCAALNEEIPLAAALRPLVESRYAGQLAQLDAVLQLDARRCAGAGAAAYWERGRLAWNERTEDERRELLGESAWLHLPGIRSAFARFLLAVATPDAFRRYREAEAA